MISSLINTTCIISSHALEEAEAVSTRLFIIRNGEFIVCGTSTELRNQYKCGYELKIDGDEDAMGNVYTLALKYFDECYINKNILELPVDNGISLFLRGLEQLKSYIGIYQYSLTIQKLEDILLKLIQT
jgi:ABC-type multidrug transport system ATPase subunit